jgi:hypothetical protein
MTSNIQSIKQEIAALDSALDALRASQTAQREALALTLAHASFNECATLTIEQASILSQLSVMTIRNMISLRKIVATRIDKRICVTCESLRAYISAHSNFLRYESIVSDADKEKALIHAAKIHEKHLEKSREYQRAYKRKNREAYHAKNAMIVS